MSSSKAGKIACLALLSLGLGTVGCAAGQGRYAEDKQMLQTADPDRIVDAHAENVERLRARMGLDAKAALASDGVVSTHTMTDDAAPAGEAHGYSRRLAEPGTCEETCGLAQDMCVSSDAICTVAEAHGDDPRFMDTCTWARDSCADAIDMCEVCTTPVVVE